jgi:dTDP-4-dehydrorhamnose 3,5-epimerase
VLAEAEISQSFVQDYHSRSRHAIVRGAHFRPGRSKLVRCVRGAVFDMVVDLQGAGVR